MYQKPSGLKAKWSLIGTKILTFFLFPVSHVGSNVSLEHIRKTPSFNLHSTTVTSDSSKQLQLYGLWSKSVKLRRDSKDLSIQITFKRSRVFTPSYNYFFDVIASICSLPIWCRSCPSIKESHWYWGWDQKEEGKLSVPSQTQHDMEGCSVGAMWPSAADNCKCALQLRKRPFKCI